MILEDSTKAAYRREKNKIKIYAGLGRKNKDLGNVTAQMYGISFHKLVVSIHSCKNNL